MELDNLLSRAKEGKLSISYISYISLLKPEANSIEDEAKACEIVRLVISSKDSISHTNIKQLLRSCTIIHPSLLKTIFEHEKLDIETNHVKILEVIQSSYIQYCVSIDCANMKYILAILSKYYSVLDIKCRDDIERITQEPSNIIVTSCYDYKELISCCVLPVNVNIMYTKEYMYGDMTINEQLFWLSADVSKSIEKCIVWKYISLEEAKIRAATKAESLPLILYSRDDLLYNSSRRPVTDMSTYKNTNTIVDENKIRIPVTRYSEGMSRGLYYNTPKEKYLGTFYYLEHESDTYLTVDNDRCMAFFNKLSAYMFFRPSLTKQGLDDIDPDGLLQMHISGKISADLVLSAEEVSKLNSDDDDACNIEKKRYAGFNLLYSSEDMLDQPLCKYCIENNIDVLIFTHIAGSYQVVSEVMDVRDRSVSFASLVHL